MALNLGRSTMIINVAMIHKKLVSIINTRSTSPTTHAQPEGKKDTKQFYVVQGDNSSFWFSMIAFVLISFDVASCLCECYFP